VAVTEEATGVAAVVVVIAVEDVAVCAADAAAAPPSEPLLDFFMGLATGARGSRSKRLRRRQNTIAFLVLFVDTSHFKQNCGVSFVESNTGLAALGKNML